MVGLNRYTASKTRHYLDDVVVVDIAAVKNGMLVDVVIEDEE